MLLAVSRDAPPERIRATPGAAGTCPGCGASLIPKCGEIVTWHWSHIAERDCDPWAEHETEWHLGWKGAFPPQWTERVIGPHRADVRLPDGTVLEFQHSSISPAEIREREAFYGRMAWLFDARVAAADAWYDDTRLSVRPNSGYATFKWRHPRRSLMAVTRPLWLDVGAGQVLEVKKLYPRGSFSGWGYLRPAEQFIRRHVMERVA